MKRWAPDEVAARAAALTAELDGALSALSPDPTGAPR